MKKLQTDRANHFVIAFAAFGALTWTSGCASHKELADIGPSTTVAVPTNFDSSRWKRNFDFDREMLLPAVSKGLVNGLTEAQALDVLGEPDARRNNDWYYLVNQKQGGHKFISLTFENGTVTGIHETTKAAEQVQQK
jgi:hypothetical protein